MHNWVAPLLAEINMRAFTPSRHCSNGVVSGLFTNMNWDLSSGAWRPEEMRKLPPPW
jgi:hypothetical protein